jgi:hypothetical protein
LEESSKFRSSPAIFAVVAVGQKKKPETNAERLRTQRERDLERAQTEREGCKRARKRDVRDAIKLERIRVKEQQRQAKLGREVEDTLVKAIQKAKVGENQSYKRGRQ